ncbi:Membrane protein involved in the export of O-antigen and teichoic acid [Thalassobacillus cyri]|uniref:Membrane protein involved in the export of O-antigen and teichoic acid n=1 Tax=Thalassobacillus cyri TaxID=571932 RepID=A0A1H4DW79_9BACI|nr:oligosaccharide flippase family protein [Thalassobacillus cyri]SEA76846.1 Membrane protein involved in the export of O-antigen and teichoic acid [Thalassobacillus cyri]
MLVNKIKSFIRSNTFLQKLIESFFGRISYLVFSLLFSLIATRIYGVEIFGTYTYAFTLVTILMIPAKAGLDNGIMYSVPKHRYKHISFSFLINLLISLVLMIGFMVIYEDPFIRFMLPLIWLASTEQLFFSMYRVDGKIKEFYFINGFLAILLRVILLVVFYYVLGESSYSLGLAVYASFVFANIIYFTQQRGKFRKVEKDFDYLKYSFPLIFATLMSTLINKVDIIMLGNMTTNKEVGIYQITFQVSSTISLFLFVLNTVFAPRISKLYHNNNLPQLRSTYVNTTRALALSAFVYFLFLVVFDDFILGMFGKEVIEGGTAMLYRNIGQVVNVSVGSVWLMLSMTGKPKFQMYANLFAFIVNIVLNLLIIPKYGMNGAAFASMVSIVITNLFGYIVVSRRFNIKVYKLF